MVLTAQCYYRLLYLTIAPILRLLLIKLSYLILAELQFILLKHTRSILPTSLQLSMPWYTVPFLVSVSLTQWLPQIRSKIGVLTVSAIRSHMKHIRIDTDHKQPATKLCCAAWGRYSALSMNIGPWCVTMLCRSCTCGDVSAIWTTRIRLTKTVNICNTIHDGNDNSPSISGTKLHK